ncbi:hypothetical protein GCM10009854_41130 [Saccharopolyspora halophila]|uniref:DUF998 domain-containing protein n=1 Tax=Saccharopolyspora halophila TaxID=405551 RepID=A0ABN3GQL6_9PSEU
MLTTQTLGRFMRADSDARVAARWEARVLAGCCACAAALYSLWVLGPWINPDLDALNGYVSEYAARDQPGSPLFRVGDGLAGLLAAAAAVAGFRYSRSGVVGWSGLLVFGVATGLDGALTPMACASFVDTGCAVRELVGALPATHALHEITSSVAALGALVAMGGLARAGIGPPARWGWAWCSATGVATAVTLAALWLGTGAGVVQRAQLALIATWLIALAVTGARPRSAGGRDA